MTLEEAELPKSDYDRIFKMHVYTLVWLKSFSNAEAAGEPKRSAEGCSSWNGYSAT